MSIGFLSDCADDNKKEAMMWISVDEKLPDERQAIIGGCKGNVYNETLYRIGEAWYWVGDNEPAMPRVLYWMPLPDAPGGE